MTSKSLKVVIIYFRPYFMLVKVSGKTDFKASLFGGTCCTLHLLDRALQVIEGVQPPTPFPTKCVLFALHGSACLINQLGDGISQPFLREITVDQQRCHSQTLSEITLWKLCPNSTQLLGLSLSYLFKMGLLLLIVYF